MWWLREVFGSVLQIMRLPEHLQFLSRSWFTHSNLLSQVCLKSFQNSHIVAFTYQLVWLFETLWVKLWCFVFQLILPEPFSMQTRSSNPCLGQSSWDESSLPSITAGNWLISCSSFSPLPYFWPLCFTSWRRDCFPFCKVEERKDRELTTRAWHCSSREKSHDDGPLCCINKMWSQTVKIQAHFQRAEGMTGRASNNASVSGGREDCALTL